MVKIMKNKKPLQVASPSANLPKDSKSFFECVTEMQAKKKAPRKQRKCNFAKGGIAIRGIRRELMLTQKEFGHLLNLSSATINLWENGAHKPSLHTLLFIINILPKQFAGRLNIDDFGYDIRANKLTLRFGGSEADLCDKD